MTVTSVTAAIAKYSFDSCNCMVDKDVGTGDFSLVLGILHVCGHVHMISQGHGLHIKMELHFLLTA